MPFRQTLSLPQTQISYLEWSGGKVPLMLLHGLADCALVWRSLGEALADNYHIVAPDLRGHGESSKPLNGYTFEEIIGDLQALMQHLGWSSAHLLGHSWSAKLLPLWTTQYPEQVRSLILVDPFFIGKIPSAFKFTFPLLYKILPFLQAMGPFSSDEEAEMKAQQLKQYRGWSALQQEAFRGGIEQKPDGTWGSKFTAAARDGAFEEVMRVAGLTDEIATPTLFVKPQQGLNRTEWQLKPYKTYLKNLKIVEVPGNHWAFMVESKAFNAVVEEFLQQQN
ncbi:alpha/beta hydrolase [Oscillatoria sp. FACHB-1406]|uniref:alpha/beta fold hydrolase n=1 Tax=Oscillatoria sp. FACHB-1406 TaxID=2692846 RepID=UPI0016877048|nr:alpha/beta hydrolase [Oscillatoria sp. FACHB-1406]MBD2578506.1 alpha/beta hydrolase [Oscillatoria sp. FACHB-1406]